VNGHGGLSLAPLRGSGNTFPSVGGGGAVGRGGPSLGNTGGDATTSLYDTVLP
jgi:hypothetical protein